MRDEPKGHLETWTVFGNHLEDFFSRTGDRLRERRYNVVLGFTRGGAILANVLSAKLTDVYPKEYAGPSLAAIRTIPNGIHKKSYDLPDFVMAGSCAPEDRNDIEVLISELIGFKEEHGLDKVRVLLVDDNLTGSTRMRFFHDRLIAFDFIDVDLLAYTRNPEFKIPKLDYTIRLDPEGSFTYLIMPWHKVHEASQVSTEYSRIILRLIFDVPKEVDLRAIQSKLSQRFRSDRIPARMRVHDEYLLIKRGETYTQIKRVAGRLEVKFPGTMFYPPKSCLRGDKNVFGDQSLCNFGEGRLTSHLCRLCSALECSKDIIEFLERNLGASFTDSYFNIGNERVDILKPDLEAVDEWMRDPLKRVSDPRFIDLDTFLVLSLDEQIKYKGDIEKRWGNWLTELFKELSATWIVTIGDEVISHSKDLLSAPELDDVLPIARERGLVPFLFVRPRKIEEVPHSEWSECGQVDHVDDWYPTIRIGVSHPTENGRGDLEFVADFDTGNPYIHLDGDRLLDDHVVPEHTYFNRNWATHLGRPYEYYLTYIRLTLPDAIPPIEPIVTRVLGVLDWADSPFRDQNGSRTAFVGRQLFRFIDLRAILDSQERATYCEGR